MLMGSFMGLFGYFDAQEVWTLRHWNTVLAEPRFLRALVNTLILGLGTAPLAISFYSVISTSRCGPASSRGGPLTFSPGSLEKQKSLTGMLG